MGGLIMTREEQIKKQADIYTDDASNYTEWSDDGGWSATNDIDLVEKAFIEGAKWADQNPKSPWISVKDDLPCNHSDLVLTYNDIPFSTKRVMVVTDILTLFLCEMKKDDDRGWIWNYTTKDKITHWFPIPEPPK